MGADLVLSIIAAVCGLLLHILKKWAEARAIFKGTDMRPTLGEHLVDTQAQTAVAVVAAVGVFTVAYGVDWLNPGMAFACGFTGNSVAESVVRQFGKK